MGAKCCVLKIRVTPDERAGVEEACASLGCSIAEYVRCAVAAYTLEWSASGAAPETVGVDASAVGELYAEARKQGVNVNQIAHALNTVAMVAADADGPLGPDARALARGCLAQAAESMPAVASSAAALQRAAESLMARRAVGIPSGKGARKCR